MPGTYALKRALHPTIAGKPVVMGNLELSMRLRELERRVNRIDRALVVIALAIISFFSILAVMG
jgi:hypothetical protein